MRSFGASGVIAATAIGIVCVLVLDSMLLGHNWAQAWSMFGLPAVLPPFLDMHTVTDAAGCARLGIDVYVVTDCDPMHRTYNYPPVWLLLGRLGVNGASTVWLGSISGIGFILSLLWLNRGLPAAAGFLSAVVLLSPAVLLCIERGNTDMVIFILLVAVCALLAKDRWLNTFLAACLAGLAIVLKLYPVFVAGIAARLSRRTALIAFGCALLTGLYVLALGDTFQMIMRNTPRPIIGAFGAPVFFKAFGLPYLSLVIAACVLAAAAISLRIVRVGPQVLPLLEGFHGIAFIVGAGVYCGTFAFFSSWSYRLIFLIMCLPQIHSWLTAEDSKGTRAIGWLLFGAILAVCWLTSHSAFTLLPHAAGWTLFTVLTATLFLSALRTSPVSLVGRAQA